MSREGKYRKTIENMRKKKTSFSFAFAVLRDEICDNVKKMKKGEVMGCQIYRKGEGKIKSRGEGGRQLNVLP